MIMKTILIALTFLLVISCTNTEYFNQLESPVRVAAKGVSERTGSQVVIVIDKNNRVKEFSGGAYFAIALYDSYEIGDTILFNQQITTKEVVDTIVTAMGYYGGKVGTSIPAVSHETLPKPDTNVISVKKEPAWWSNRMQDTAVRKLAVHTLIFSDTLIAKTDQGDITIYSVHKK